MGRLSSNDYQNVIHTINVYNSNIERLDLPNLILQSLSELFKTNGGVFIPASDTHEGLELTNAILFNIDWSYTNQYLKNYWRYDPHLQKVLDSRLTIFKTNDIVPYSRWVKLEYYNEFCRPQNLDYELDICLRMHDRLLGNIALFRSRQQQDFDSRDILKAELLAPHITCAIHEANFLSKINHERKLLRRGMECLSLGIILLDSELMPVYSNPQARRICLFIKGEESAKGNKLKSEGFPAVIVQDCLDLKSQQHNWNEIDFNRHERIISLEHNNIFRLKSSIIWDQSETSPKLYFVILLEDISKSSNLKDDNIKRQYHLTNREMEITQLIAGGLTNNEIAKSLYISKNTVETHLSNIFEKTNAKNRTSLANLIST